jgi:hypothetical protein
MQQAAWAKNLKGIKEQFTVVGPAKQLTDYAPKPPSSGGMNIQIPMTMYGAKIEQTGAGEDGIVQPDKPVDAVVTDQGPKMLHEGEFKIVGPDGKMAVIPAKMIPQEMLAAFEQQSGTGGYAAGESVYDPTAITGTMGGGGTTSEAASKIPGATLASDNKVGATFYTDKEKTGLNTLEGVATGKSDAFSAIANRSLDNQAARNQFASKAYQQTASESPELTVGGRAAGLAGVTENANANMSSIQGTLAANAQNAAVGAAGSLTNSAQSAISRTNSEKQAAYNDAIARGDTTGAATIASTMTGNAGVKIDMSAPNYERSQALVTDITADAASRPGQPWKGSPAESKLQTAWDLSNPGKAGQYDSPEFKAYADNIWGNGQQTEEGLYLDTMRSSPFYIDAPDPSTDTNGDMRADEGPMKGKFTKQYYEEAAQAVIDAKVSNGWIPGVNPDGSVYWTGRDAEGNEQVMWGNRETDAAAWFDGLNSEIKKLTDKPASISTANAIAGYLGHPPTVQEYVDNAVVVEAIATKDFTSVAASIPAAVQLLKLEKNGMNGSPLWSSSRGSIYISNNNGKGINSTNFEKTFDEEGKPSGMFAQWVTDNTGKIMWLSDGKKLVFTGQVTPGGGTSDGQGYLICINDKGEKEYIHPNSAYVNPSDVGNQSLG